MPIFTPTVLAVTSVGLSAAGAFGAAKDKKRSANYNAAVNRNNAEIAQTNAEDIAERGEIAAQAQGVRTRQTIGAAKAALAGSGILVNDAGSTGEQLIDDLAKAGALDVLRLREAASREEHRALVQGVNFEAQAGLFDLQATSINPAFAGLSAGLRSASNNADTLFA